MANSGSVDPQVGIFNANYDRKSEVKAFDDSKSGVKGLVDAGILKVPRMFIHKRNSLEKGFGFNDDSNVEVPLINFGGIGEYAEARCKIVEEVRNACEKWGLFRLINHGIPDDVLEEMMNGSRRFHEQDVEVKKEYYTRDYATKNLLYNSNYNLHESSAACWRDTLTFITGIHRPTNHQVLPPICRDITMEYIDRIMKLGNTLFKLLSEALGLNPNHLKDMGCAHGIYALSHYYPKCPEPQLTMGSTTHVDSGFITILLQDKIGGLQVLHEDKWVDVKPLHGEVVVNVGSILQLISNDKFRSPYHRVVAQREGPRVSVACVFRSHHEPEISSRLYGPIRELLSEDNPPRFTEITIKNILQHKHGRNNKEGDGGNPKLPPTAIDQFRLLKISSR